MMPSRRKWVASATILAFCIGAPGILAMAQDRSSTGDPEQQDKGLLVAPAIVSGNKPAQIQLHLDSAAIPANAQLEFAVKPTAVSTTKYVVVVRQTQGSEKEIGSFSFFPPPSPGKVAKFLVDAGPLVTAAKENNTSRFDLSVQLVPVNQSGDMSGSALRILGARLVGG